MGLCVVLEQAWRVVMAACRPQCLHPSACRLPAAHSTPCPQDLFIQAMATIKALPHTDPESFFQQAAIHGGCGARV